ncbi:MAG: monofunctional biosynthetic peptidoglycan transglycosylase [Balneolaceae bacterium]|nr:MAG: monofunctional biosynthetic peptidoglycan transglycosylase [Balneolaceae bacterium]
MNYKEKPFYKRFTFYPLAIFAALFSLLFLLVISVLALRWVNPPATSFTLQEDWQALSAERYNLRDYWISADDIPTQMKWAVVASEDQLFWEHRGFDVESIREAWEQRQAGVRSRGASTISQQVAKNLYLWPAHSFFRKGVEAGITILIELFWPKERIIEMYLNIAEFGPGFFGIGKASEHFFDRSATQLTPEQAARMAAVLPSPKRMRVNPPSPYASERSQWILRQMTQLTGIAYIQTSPESETEADDLDPLILDAAFLLDESISDTLMVIETDTSVTDSLLIELDLNDPLLEKDE